MKCAGQCGLMPWHVFRGNSVAPHSFMLYQSLSAYSWYGTLSLGGQRLAVYLLLVRLG